MRTLDHHAADRTFAVSNLPRHTEIAPGATTIRVLFADDHQLVCARIGAWLAAAPDITLVGRTNTEDVISAAAELLPDVVVVDPPVANGELVGKLTANGDARVLVLTDTRNAQAICEALVAGAAGYFLKGNAPQALLAAVRALSVSGTILDPVIVDGLVNNLSSRPVAVNRAGLPAPLTAREREVLINLAEGLSDAQIAGRLFISAMTVRTHVGHLLMKLCARNRAHAVTIAYRRGLVRLPALRP
jgi:DNA-binding NarL/FixJ family response regulator